MQDPLNLNSALQLPVYRPDMQETTSLGAAYAAGLGIGFWTMDNILSLSAAESSQGKVFKPQAHAEDVSKRYQKWQKAVSRSLDLADLSE